MAKPVAVVIRVACFGQKPKRVERHHENSDARSNHRSDRQRLCLCFAKLAARAFDRVSASSPTELGDRHSRFDANVIGDPAVPHRDDSIRHLADRRVMRDHSGRRTKLAVDPLDGFQHRDSGRGVEAPVPVGSSHSKTSGRFAIACAIATRCCSPPESCEGKWSCRSAKSTSSSALEARHWIDGDVRHEADVFTCRQTRDQIVELKHEPHRLASKEG